MYLLLGAAHLSACQPLEQEVTQIAVSAYQLENCPIATSPEELDDYELFLSALGPFRATAFDAETVKLESTDAVLGFSGETVGVEAIAEGGPRRFHGYTERRGERGIDVLLWPDASACELHRANPTDGSTGGDEPDSGQGSDYPGGGAGQALGFAASQGLALVAGEDAPDQRAGAALTFETETGHARVLDRESGLGETTVAHATLTAFGTGLLLAGGEDPFATGAAPALLGSARVFDAAERRFVGGTLPLVFERSRHAAIELSTTGETLLVGGRDASPPDDPDAPPPLITQFEAVSPRTSSSSISALARLERGRLSPSVLALDDGTLFVGGGVAPRPSDGRLTPVTLVEWFEGDGSAPVRRGPEGGVTKTADLEPLANRTFAALPGGGILTVGSCDPAEVTDCFCVPEDGIPAAACEHGLKAAWLSGDFEPAIEPVAFVFIPASGCPTPERPLLAPGSDGAPWLVSVTDPDVPACLFRFHAWPADYSGDYVDGDGVTLNPFAHPRFELELTYRLAPPPDPRVPLLSLGPDAFAWVTDATPGALAGVRLGSRGSLSRDEFAFGELDLRRPLHLAPDRRVPVDSPAGAVPRLYDGVLTLAPFDPPLTVWVTDTRYDDVTVTLDITPQGDERPAPPLVLFGASVLGAEDGCAWPALPANPALPLVVRVVRAGGRVSLAVPGATHTCDLAAGALPLGLRAGAATSVVRDLTVERD